MQTVKSATTAGLLGIFLGQYGAHDWYLGKKVKGAIHVALAAAGVILVMVATIIVANMDEFRLSVYGPPAYAVAMYIVAYLVLFGNGIWGLVEGIILLTKGDAGLQAQGYTTALGTGTQKSTTNKVPAKTTAQATSSKAVAKPAPKPLDPKAKKKIIMWSCIGGGAFVALCVIAIIFSLVFRIDYGESYRKANEVGEELSDLVDDTSACERVASYANSTWTSEKTYNDHVSKCLDSLDHDDSEIVELGKTSGVKRDKDIKAQYDKFKKAYDQAFPDRSNVEATLKVYKAWHTFVIKSNTASSAIKDDDAYRKAADALKESGDNTLVEYAEGWLERGLAYSKAYREYMEGSNKGTSATRTAMTEARTNFRNYVNQNEPNIEDIAAFEPGDVSDVYSTFKKLYNMISNAYEENYDGKGDCVELLDSVYCD